MGTAKIFEGRCDSIPIKDKLMHLACESIVLKDIQLVGLVPTRKRYLF